MTGEMEDIEEITTEVTERAQTYLDSKRDEASSIATTDSFKRNINNNWVQKSEVEDLQSARYQGDLEAVTNRFDQLNVTEEGKKKSSTKRSSEKIDRKIKAVDADQKDEPTEMNDQQHKQPWQKSNLWTVEGKDDASAMSVDKKAVRSINIFDDGEPLRNANQGRLKDKGRKLIHIKPSQGNESISDNEDDELIQIQRTRADEFVSKCSKRPQRQLPIGRQEKRWVKERVDRSANIYQENHCQLEREMDPRKSV